MRSVSASVVGGILMISALTAIITGVPNMPFSAKLALMVFLAAIFFWSFTSIDATYIAVVAALLMSGIGLSPGKSPLSGLSDPFVAFVIAGFMLGGAYKKTGLSERIALGFASKSTRIDQLFYLLTTALVLLSFIIPSTSARAALLMPVYLAIASATTCVRIRKALAILFPAMIVLSCITSFTGAAANLMTADFIEKFTGERITYWQWLLLGGPFGVISCYASAWLILRLFLTADDRKKDFRLQITPESRSPEQTISGQKVISVTIAMVVGWVSEPVHGIDAGWLAFAGTLLLCTPGVGVFSLKQALKEVEWSLVIFMAATIGLSQGLVESGLTGFLMAYLSTAVPGHAGWVVMILLFVIALMSHLLIHSRTARAAVLMPVLIPLGMSAGGSGLLVAFFSNAAMGYCLTLPICAKPVAMFSTSGEDGYETSDLLRLSAWLLPLHLILLLGAYWLYLYLWRV